ncbi:MAG: alpha-amylase [Gemmatimonadetes bacterium]|nr:alpha-amylase [Gemmatimonadota bacterium]
MHALTPDSTAGLRRAVLATVLALPLLASCATAPTARHPQPGTPAFAARTALYEVFVRDFSAEGTFRGVIGGLDRIQATGAEVIWLMPIHPVGELNRKGTLGSSYSVRDYRAINPEYGTAADLRALVDAVHARGMKLILDWVPNHTAWDHVWVTEHPEYYARNEAGEMTHPRDLEGNLTDWTDVVELEYDNPALRRAMTDAMKYWLEEFDIDGYRVDVAGFIPPDFYREAIPELRSVKPILLLAEWGDLWLHEVGFDLTYPWSSYHRLKEVWHGGRAAGFIEAELEELAGMPEGGYRMRMTTNHDETAWDQPPVTLFGGPAGARAAFIAMALLPGPPLLYNGQEVESAQKLPLFEKEAIEWSRPGAAETRAFYRRVVDLSRTHPSLTGGGLVIVRTDVEQDVIAYRRGDVVVLVNTRPGPVRVTTGGLTLEGARDLLSGRLQGGDAVDLPGHGAAVLQLPDRQPAG